MNRRELLILLAGAGLAGSQPVVAQQKAMPVIGFLGARSHNAPLTSAFQQGLSETGYAKGRNVAIEYRWAEGRFDRLSALAADHVDRKVDVILPFSSVSALAAKTVTSTLPIVFIVGRHPIEFGLVDGLSRPGGYLPGFNELLIELTPKRLELLSELVPEASVIAVLVYQSNSNAQRIMRDVREAVSAKGVQAHILRASTESEIDVAFSSAVQLQVGALLVGTDAFFESRDEQLASLASRYKVPAIYEDRRFVEVGYGLRFRDLWRQVGVYLGRILNGTKPADLPVRQPTNSQLVVNLKTAKALGLTIPPAILARATEVVE
jgi:putative tryptophan/tyrosine transport system substrate-binding protein